MNCQKRKALDTLILLVQTIKTILPLSTFLWGHIEAIVFSSSPDSCKLDFFRFSGLLKILLYLYLCTHCSSCSQAQTGAGSWPNYDWPAVFWLGNLLMPQADIVFGLDNVRCKEHPSDTETVGSCRPWVETWSSNPFYLSHSSSPCHSLSSFLFSPPPYLVSLLCSVH